MDTSKKLYLSRTDKKIAGVCGGIAEYLSVDATVVRVIAVVIGLLTGGAAIVAYLVMALIIPKPPLSNLDNTQ
jgi:phage shock protein PspC (stress-responsive transcriptional regulator)